MYKRSDHIIRQELQIADVLVLLSLETSYFGNSGNHEKYIKAKTVTKTDNKEKRFKGKILQA